MAEQWSDYSDTVISEIDGRIGKKYKTTVRALLKNPDKYIGQEGISVLASNMREDANHVIDALMEEVKEQRVELNNAIAKAEAVTSQLNQNISMQTKQYKTPFITPIMINRDDANDESIYIDTVDQGILALVERLVMTSSYIADYSYSYKEHKIGSWLFSGQKMYLLSAYVPPNDAYLLDESRDEINGLFDIADAIVG
jgi:hypothetical protein